MMIMPLDGSHLNIDTSEDDTVCLYIGNKEVVIKHNDVGLSVDIYDTDDEEGNKLEYEHQHWFTDRGR